MMRKIFDYRKFLMSLCGFCLLCGCDMLRMDEDFDTGADSGAAAPMVQLGGTDDGGDGFVDWSGGSATPQLMNAGSQVSLRHIWLGVRMKNMQPQHVHFKIEFFDATTGASLPPGSTEITTGFKIRDGDWLSYSGMPGFLKDPCKIKGRKLRARMTLTDPSGSTAVTEEVIIPRYNGICP